MPLPHFNIGLNAINRLEPIYKSRYDVTFITEDNEQLIGNVESFEILNDVVTCKIQNFKHTSISDIKSSKIMMIELSNSSGNITRIDVLTIKNNFYKLNFDWNDKDFSYIETSFLITNMTTHLEDNLFDRNAMNG